MINAFINFNYNCYLIYIRYRISNIKNINHIIKIIKNIAFFYKSTDAITNLLSQCFIKYPLNEEEMQLISIIQQEYDMTNGVENYCSIVLWLSIIYSINNHKLLLL